VEHKKDINKKLPIIR